MHHLRFAATKNWPAFRLCAAMLFAVLPSCAQQTTQITLANMSGSAAQSVTFLRPITLSGTGALNPFGSAAVSFTGSQDDSTYSIQGTLHFSLNRLDSFDVVVPPQSIFKMTTLSLPGAISGGTGIFSGASGSVSYTFQYTGNSSSSGTFALSGSGSITVGPTTTAITLGNFTGNASVASIVTGTLITSPLGSVTPLGNATVTYTVVGDPRKTPGRLIQGSLTFVFNPNDSFTASFTANINSNVFNLGSAPISLPSIITGGTGKFSGATGSLSLSLALNNTNSTFALTGSGTIIQPAPGGPVITSVNTSGVPPNSSNLPSIAQNTWIEIKGTNLTPPNTVAGGVFWSNAPEFASGQMPTQLGGISVKVNGKPAYIYWFCSAVTTSFCGSDQINILTPLDNTVGQVQIVVTNGTTSSAPFNVNLQTIAPSFLLFSTRGDPVATHPLANTLLGPAALFPGLSTPAQPNETIVLWAIGFPLPSLPPLPGSANQSGPLPTLPVCTILGTPIPVTSAALVSPGLYTLYVTMPNGASNGDNAISCAYNSVTTPAGDVIAVQR